MANTITQRTLLGGAKDRYVVRQINIISDGSQETNTVVFDNSAFANDVSRGRVMKIESSGSSCVCRLAWDQTTDVTIASFDPVNSQSVCFKKEGGNANPNGAGATGDILLSTTGLDSGDEVTIIITVKQ